MNMHQDNLKSAVHRSLTKSLLSPSEDGNETAQCRAIGRSRTTAAVELISGSSHRGQDRTPLKGKEEEKAMAYRNSNDFQLLQVSTEAHKLAQMIDSWSRATNMDSRSQFFAEDLLRGALDLQESLDMLKKLQDASKKMSRISNKQKQEFTGKKDEEISAHGLGSKRYAVCNSQNRLHEPPLSADEFSRHCVEELKQVIKESLYKQNILPSSSDDEKSSSRSMRYSTGNLYEDKYLEQNTVPVKSSCSTDQPKKARSSNLIAKLMGLEEAPSEIVQPISREKKNCVNSPRPRFDIDMPKSRKMQFLVQNNDQKQNGLDEIIETTHFKGLLKQRQVEKKVLEPPFFGNTELKHGRNLRKVDQLPPIVIMKPLHLLYQESNVHKEHALDEALMQDRNQAAKLVQENDSSVSDRKHMLARTREQKEVKHVEKDVTESLPNYETPTSQCHKQQRKKAILAHKKNTEEQKPSRLNVKKQEEKGVKATRMSLSHPKTSAVQAKPSKELPAARTNASTHVTVPQNQDLKSPSRPIPKATTDSVKDKNKSGAKPVRKSSIVESMIDDKKYKENGTAIGSCNKMNDVPKTTGTFNADDLFEQAEQDTEPCNPDNMSKDHKIFCEEATPRNNQDGRNSSLIEEVIRLPDCKRVDVAVTGIEDDLKNIFLSSQSFLGCAKKFFGVDATKHIYHQRESADEVRICDSKLFLDISEELMAQKYHQQKRTMHPLLQAQSWGRITYISMDKLVEEISNGISKLTSYSKLDSVATSEDSLYLRLERELMCKDTAINTAWDIGWDNWICLEEADQVVEEVGKQILSLLIEEAALELI